MAELTFTGYYLAASPAQKAKRKKSLKQRTLLLTGIPRTENQPTKNILKSPPMETTSKIFASLFITLGIITAGTAIGGATHQWFIAGLCAVVAFALLADASKKIESNEV